VAFTNRQPERLACMPHRLVHQGRRTGRPSLVRTALAGAEDSAAIRIERMIYKYKLEPYCLCDPLAGNFVTSSKRFDIKSLAGIGHEKTFYFDFTDNIRILHIRSRGLCVNPDG